MVKGYFIDFTLRSSDVLVVGLEVKHLSEGTRVALEPGATCRVCDDCKAGRYQASLSVLARFNC